MAGVVFVLHRAHGDVEVMIASPALTPGGAGLNPVVSTISHIARPAKPSLERGFGVFCLFETRYRQLVVYEGNKTNNCIYV